MLGFFVRRLGHTILVLLAISLFVSFAIRLTGDPAVAMFQGGAQPTPEDIARLREALGTDQPFWVQYGRFLAGVARGDLGRSFRNNQPVLRLIADRFPATLRLALGSMAVALVIAFPIGIYSAIRRGGVLDFVGRTLALLGISFPNFWLGIMAIIIFAVHLKWLPPSGYRGWQYLILPSATLGLILASILMRLIRSSMLEVLGQQYVMTARAKGLAERVVIYKHALRNALIPTVTFVGLQFGALLGGTVILEQVFAWPGLGRLALDAINQRDYPVVQASVLVLALILVVINLVVDVSYSFLDPRIKVGSSS